MIKIKQLLTILKKTYPEARCDLNFTNAWELLISTMLSQQATDKSVVAVTPKLFKAYQTPESLSKADPKDVEAIIKPVGLSPTKSRNVVMTSKILVEKCSGIVPHDREKLITFPGVGRKTANVVLGNFYKIPAVTVDTHVKRISFRLGLTKEKNERKIESDLEKKLPESEWTHFTHLIIRLGREFCQARKPNCDDCPLQKICPKILK